MIGRLSGILLEKHPPLVIVDVGGVGYEVDVPMSTFYALPGLGEKVSLRTHFVVREDAQLLYGFLTEDERATFRQLLKISGVGPKLALAVLSNLSVAELAQTINAGDAVRLAKTPGVGKKTAERLVLELGGKLVSAGGDAAPGGGSPLKASNDTVNALLSLGYNDKEAQWAVGQLPKDVSVEDGIRQALRLLSKGK
jgi:Holliday junction DNA helicase RuvA